MAISVKVIRVPGAVSEVGLNDGSTVQDALNAANVTVGQTESLQVNGTATTTAQRLSDGDRVIIAKGAKGA